MKASGHKNEKYIQKIFNEEFYKVLNEDYRKGRIDEGFMDNMKKAASGVFGAYKKIFTAYSEVLKDMFSSGDIEKQEGDEFLAAANDEIDNMLGAAKKAGNVKDPSQAAEIANELSDEELSAQIEKLLQQAEDPEDQKKLTNIARAADKVGNVADKQLGKVKNPKNKRVMASKEDSARLQDLLNSEEGNWEVIRKSTKDRRLQKAMDYIYNVATTPDDQLAERISKLVLINILSEQNAPSSKISRERVQKALRAILNQTIQSSNGTSYRNQEVWNKLIDRTENNSIRKALKYINDYISADATVSESFKRKVGKLYRSYLLKESSDKRYSTQEVINI
jgi:polyhydroxyalkanoate synthesis regulator phasin